MPRDFNTDSHRRRRRSASSDVSNTQVSINEEITVSVESSGAPPDVRLVNSAVMLAGLEEVDHPREHRTNVNLCAGHQQIRHRIHDHDVRLQLLDGADA